MLLYISEESRATGQNDEVKGQEEKASPTDSGETQFSSKQDLFGEESSYVIYYV